MQTAERKLYLFVAIDSLLANFISAHNFGRRVKTHDGRTPYDYNCKVRASEPERFTLNPIHHMPGLNS